MPEYVIVDGTQFNVVEGKSTVSLVSKFRGRFVGYEVNTLSGLAYMFSFHGNRYVGSDAIDTFRRMAAKEL